MAQDESEFLLKNLLVSSCLLTSSFFRSESVLGVLQLSFGSCNSGGGFCLLVMVDRQIALLLFQLSH